MGSGFSAYYPLCCSLCGRDDAQRAAKLTQPGSLQTLLMQTGCGGGRQGGTGITGQATQSVAARELVLLEKNIAAEDDSATG
ncbi:MAG TPA: hypothetical protein VHW01_15330 [Polyangiaceae bacterium]|jgi:hypothetical protein|nr:hypothetical protein [Polyangiaceae bacterium]